MIRELIQLAEEIYARGHNPSQDPKLNGEDFQDYAVRLGHLIEEVGHAISKYQERIEQQAFYIRRLENQIKELKDDNGR